jgi:hypothetical protein
VSKKLKGLESTGHRSLSVGELDHVVENLETFREAEVWVRTYLARPHPALGRPGTVCPFAQPALSKDTLRIAVVRLTPDNKGAQIRVAIKYHLEAFVSQAGSEDERLLRATLLLFPDISAEEAPELIDGTKEELKAIFVQQGLMLGEFHARNESPGLHNSEFRPLRSPTPMLAIRHMVSTDFAFLNRSAYDVTTRLRYLDAYLSAPGISSSSRREVELAAASLRAGSDKYH